MSVSIKSLVFTSTALTMSCLLSFGCIPRTPTTIPIVLVSVAALVIWGIVLACQIDEGR